jgi:hypothetical protein
MDKMPIKILVNDPVFGGYAQDIHNVTTQKIEALENLRKNFKATVSDYENKESEIWDNLKADLMEYGYIDSLDVLLSYENGVVYLELNNSIQDISMKSLIDKLFNRKS